MPPSGFSKKAVPSILQFVHACYEDLENEVKAGKHPNMNEAINHELKQLERVLNQLHIDEAGRLVKR